MTSKALASNPSTPHPSSPDESLPLPLVLLPVAAVPPFPLCLLPLQTLAGALRPSPVSCVSTPAHSIPPHYNLTCPRAAGGSGIERVFNKCLLSQKHWELSGLQAAVQYISGGEDGTREAVHPKPRIE